MNDDDLLIDVEQQKREVAKWFKDFLRDMENNVCPHCGTTITSKRQVGRCVYADPCGCRLYQGNLDAAAPRDEKRG